MTQPIATPRIEVIADTPGYVHRVVTMLQQWIEGRSGKVEQTDEFRMTRFAVDMLKGNPWLECRQGWTSMYLWNVHVEGWNAVWMMCGTVEEREVLFEPIVTPSHRYATRQHASY